MGKRKKMKKGAGYRGFRMGVIPKSQVNLKALENAEVLTSLQHEIVKKRLDAHIKEVEIKNDKGEVIKNEKDEAIKVKANKISVKYINRLEALLAKSFNEAKVDGKGNAWEKPVQPTQEEIDKMNRDAVEKGKKGKSRKDLEKENESS